MFHLRIEFARLSLRTLLAEVFLRPFELKEALGYHGQYWYLKCEWVRMEGGRRLKEMVYRRP